MKDQNDTNLRFIGAAAGGMGAPENPNDPDWPSRDPKLNTEVRLGQELERDGGVRPGYLDGGAVRANAAQPVTQIAGQRLALLVAMMCVGGVGAVGEEASASGGAVGDVRMGDAGGDKHRHDASLGDVRQTRPRQPMDKVARLDISMIGHTQPGMGDADVSTSTPGSPVQEDTITSPTENASPSDISSSVRHERFQTLKEVFREQNLCPPLSHHADIRVYFIRVGDVDQEMGGLYVIGDVPDYLDEGQSSWYDDKRNVCAQSNDDMISAPIVYCSFDSINECVIVRSLRHVFDDLLFQGTDVVSRTPIHDQDMYDKFTAFISDCKSKFEVLGTDTASKIIDDCDTLLAALKAFPDLNTAERQALAASEDLAARTSRIHLALREVYAEHAAKQAAMAQDTEPRPSAMRVDPTRA